jgi:hypothetical protein
VVTANSFVPLRNNMVKTRRRKRQPSSGSTKPSMPSKPKQTKKRQKLLKVYQAMNAGRGVKSNVDCQKVGTAMAHYPLEVRSRCHAD